VHLLYIDRCISHFTENSVILLERATGEGRTGQISLFIVGMLQHIHKYHCSLWGCYSTYTNITVHCGDVTVHTQISLLIVGMLQHIHKYHCSLWGCYSTYTNITVHCGDVTAHTQINLGPNAKLSVLNLTVRTAASSICTVKPTVTKTVQVQCNMHCTVRVM
jgi:hypothetical protein